LRRNDSDRDLTAWLGLTPERHSGNKSSQLSAYLVAVAGTSFLEIEIEDTAGQALGEPE
jgi:hypothetical protein